MSGEFKHHVCGKCDGDGHTRAVGELWDDFRVCPQCEGGGTLYEYVPDEPQTPLPIVEIHNSRVLDYYINELPF